MGDSDQRIDADIYSTGKPPRNSDSESLPEKAKSLNGIVANTIESLRLDIDSAINGRIDKILPDGFRDRKCGLTYPLPSNLADIQRVATVPIMAHSTDAGSVYVRRAIRIWKKKQSRRISALHDTERKGAKIENAQREFSRRAKELKAEARQIVDDVRAEAEKAVASLHDLFALGREGIEGQMRAHLSNSTWNGEQIDARAFRECFRMVSQTVKGMGVAPDQRDKARDVVMEEVAKSVEATRSALSSNTEEDEVQY